MSETLDSGVERTHRVTDVAEWPVRRKVALVLAVPLLLAAVLGGLRVQSALSESSDATATASQVTVLGPSVAYLSAAEDAAMVFRETEDKAQREAALRAVNEAAADLETAWASADLSEAEREQVRALLTSTQGLRDGSSYSLVSTAVNALTKLEADVTLGIAEMTDTGSRTESQIGLVGQLNEGRLAVTQQQLLVLPKPELIPKNELFGYLGVESAAISNLELQLPGNEDVGLLREYNASNAGLLGIGTPDLKGSAPIRLYDNLTADLLTQIEDRLADAASASQREAIVVAVLTGLALLLAIALALVVSRFLVGPIQKVRDGALEVAHERLPDTVRRIRAGQHPGEIEPIAVTTHEEMGQLARAVDDLHGTAVRLAQGEAELRSRVGDMFVTLSRRNTSLVNQQLRLIERLERDEEDPQRLESLFKLDHLASRMRRTAESLVVLADAPTQHSELSSLSVAEAIQAATAGVQDYQRVRLGPAPDLRLNGAAAPDLVHLFTELVDNALAFSPPTSEVTVTTETPAGLVLVEIHDKGLGIDQASLVELNETLRTGAEVTADTARRMGVFVVSRLARRHGMTVTLERNADGGTTAKVFIPRALLAAAGAPAAEGPATSEDSVAPVSVLGDANTFRRPDAETAPATPAEQPDEVVARDQAPTRPTDPGDALSAVINANIRLPQRQPGTAAQPSELTPVLSVDTPRTPLPPEPVRDEELVDGATDDDADEQQAEEIPEETVAAAADDELSKQDDEREPVAEPTVLSAFRPISIIRTPERERATPVNGSAANGTSPHEPGSEPAAQPASSQPLDTLSAPLESVPDTGEDSTPLYRMLRSSWFTANGESKGWDSGEADRGWEAADRATDTAPSRLTRSGLPVRDPGNRLVPGGVTTAAGSVRRDPDAIRARLAAHAAGVARGRQATGTPSVNGSTVETNEDVTP
ncbi:ATP-binding protein [Nocardioides sp.]|uniref:ATP-binding protein n=1 Tax=Nocardioides sp. TaxID=35761 RepID=UPI002ED497FF